MIRKEWTGQKGSLLTVNNQCLYNVNQGPYRRRTEMHLLFEVLERGGG